MTDPRDDRPAWEPPPDAQPPAGSPPAYGAPGSASYGKYGQGQADPVPPPPPPPGAPYPPPGPYGQQYPPQQYGYAPTPARSAALSGLGTAVWVLAAAVTALYWVGAALAPAADRRYTAAGDDTVGLFTAYDGVSSLTGLVTLAAWVVTSIWLMRARQNAVVVHPGGQRRSAVWVWIGWFVPIVSWWFPKQILDDTGATVATATGRQRRNTTPYWTAWVATNLLSGASAVSSLRAAPPDVVVPALDVLLAILMTVALVFWVPLVRGLSVDSDVMTEGRR